MNENDTLVMITKPQLVKINLRLVDAEYYQNTTSVLTKELSLSDTIILNLKTLSLRKDSIINMERSKFEESQRLNKVLKESMDKQKSRQRKLLLGIGASGLIVGLLIGLIS